MYDEFKQYQKLVAFHFIGGPGSGRGTQCEKICLKYGDFVHLSSGELMKAEVMSGSSRGGKLYQLMSSGQPVPDEIVTDILAEAMCRKASGNKVIQLNIKMLLS